MRCCLQIGGNESCLTLNAVAVYPAVEVVDLYLCTYMVVITVGTSTVRQIFYFFIFLTFGPFYVPNRYKKNLTK